jgi:enolase
MVVIRGVSAKIIRDSRREKTILVSIRTNVGKFSASAPNGKSKGKFEAKPYKNSIEKDIETLRKFKEYFSKDEVDKFEDLRRIEDIVDNHVGANTLFALESAVLKALAKEKKKQIWQLINLEAKKFPRLVGNCIGGGIHSEGKRPDFQEFLLIPKTKKVGEAFRINREIKKSLEFSLKERDSNFTSKKNDEDAWNTSLNEKEILDILKKFKVDKGVDIAASSFSKRKKYVYSNPPLTRSSEEQLNYISNLIKNYNLLYIEDPFSEEEFESFSKLLKKFPNALIVGDDLAVTNEKRLKKAIEEKSINAIIVKPNQNGSLINLKNVCSIAKKNNLKLVFSHRSGETDETILADLAFGFGADFFKCGITGKEREVKIKRLIEIERKLRNWGNF